MLFYCGPSYYLIQSPCNDQVLTEVLPYGDSDKTKVTANIRRGKRPSHPTDPSQNRWLQGRIWDMITTCWSGKPEQRWELSVVHYVFSTPNYQDALAEVPPVGHENLTRLAEELWYTFLILPLGSGEHATLEKMQKYIYNAISRGRTSPTTLSSAEAAASVETLREVPFPY
jgi:hypothetical protein